MNIRYEQIFDGFTYYYDFPNGFTFAVSNHQYTDGNQGCLMKGGEVVVDDNFFQSHILENLNADEIMALLWEAQRLRPNHEVYNIKELLLK